MIENLTFQANKKDPFYLESKTGAHILANAPIFIVEINKQIGKRWKVIRENLFFFSEINAF